MNLHIQSGMMQYKSVYMCCIMSYSKHFLQQFRSFTIRGELWRLFDSGCSAPENDTVHVDFQTVPTGNPQVLSINFLFELSSEMWHIFPRISKFSSGRHWKLKELKSPSVCTSWGVLHVAAWFHVIHHSPSRELDLKSMVDSSSIFPNICNHTVSKPTPSFPFRKVGIHPSSHHSTSFSSGLAFPQVLSFKLS